MYASSDSHRISYETKHTIWTSAGAQDADAAFSFVTVDNADNKKGSCIRVRVIRKWIFDAPDLR